MTYEFDAALWLWAARQADSWTFVSLPTDIADEILDLAGGVSRGFGSLRVNVTIGDTDWRTSIFPSTSGTYVLGKIDVRQSVSPIVTFTRSEPKPRETPPARSRISSAMSVGRLTKVQLSAWRAAHSHSAASNSYVMTACSSDSRAHV